MQQKKLLVAAIVLFAFAALLVLRQTAWNPDNRRSTGPTPEQMIRAIQQNPHMPDRAKEIAIGQIRARMGSQAGLGVPPSSSASGR